MRVVFAVLFVLYILGAIGVFAMHTQMPVTFGLAIVRALCWPISIIVRDFVPRGRPLPMD